MKPPGDDARGRIAAGLIAAALACLTGLAPLPAAGTDQPQDAPRYHSPFRLAFSPGGDRLAVSDYTAGTVVLIHPGTGRIVATIPIGGAPAGVAWSPDGRQIYVSAAAGGCVFVAQASRPGALPGAGSGAESSDAADRLVRRLPCGPQPVDIAVAAGGELLLTANAAGDSLSRINLASRGPARHVAAGREPYALAVTPDGELAVVADRLPEGDASSPMASAAVTLIDLHTGRAITSIDLPPNSTNVHGVCTSPDGRWAYAVHTLARTQLPTEQIEYGWINANAMTVIDVAGRRRYATVLLDRFNDGAANPFGVTVSPDGDVLWLTLSGVHQLGKMDLARLHAQLRAFQRGGRTPAERERNDSAEETTARGSMEYSDTWQLGFEDPASVELVTGALPAEYGQGRYLGGVFRRIDLPGNGPRGVAVSPDGKLVAVAMYYSGEVVLVDRAKGEVVRSVSLGKQPDADPVRRGERIFHDANCCFQRWLNCATCHPDGRADGLNWDLMNDGIGNPKNTRSLLWSFRTPPAMSRGVRADMAAAAVAGFRHLLFQEPPPADLAAVQAYLRSLAPEPSPRLVDGRLSAAARRGKALFESPQVGCARCHPAPLYTDLRLHNVGTGTGPDESGRFDTPTLVELRRTAPYLHHGRAADLRSVLRAMNPRDRHGKTAHLTAAEIDAIVRFLESL